MFSHYQEKDGLPGNFVVGTLEDTQGYLWINKHGLAKFDPRTETFKNYDVSDGLQGNEFVVAYLKANDGALLFGGQNGFNMFYPEQISTNPYIPPLVFTDFQLAAVKKKTAESQTKLTGYRQTLQRV